MAEDQQTTTRYYYDGQRAVVKALVNTAGSEGKIKGSGVLCRKGKNIPPRWGWNAEENPRSGGLHPRLRTKCPCRGNGIMAFLQSRSGAVSFFPSVEGSSLPLIMYGISLLVGSGCTKDPWQNNKMEQVTEDNTVSAMYVVARGDEDKEELPLIAAFAGDIPIRVVYYIRKDGTFIWSKRWDGDAPYYRGRICVDKIAQLKKDLQFLEKVNPQVKFNWSVGPGGFAVLTMYETGVLLNITASDRFTGVGGYLPLENEEVDRLIEILQKDTIFSEKEARNYADSLWGYVMQLLEEYIPEEGEIVEDVSYTVERVRYSYELEGSH